MPTDRLDHVKQLVENTSAHGGNALLLLPDVRWLIDEVERLRAIELAQEEEMNVYKAPMTDRPTAALRALIDEVEKSLMRETGLTLEQHTARHIKGEDFPMAVCRGLLSANRILNEDLAERGRQTSEYREWEAAAAERRGGNPHD